MADDDSAHYTYNELTNEDKELLLRHGYVPGELSPEDQRELLADLRQSSDVDDPDGDRLSNNLSADERDS